MKQRINAVLLVMVVAAVFSGCKTTVERIVRVTDTSQNTPLPNKPFQFAESSELEPLVQLPLPVRATLDGNGEALVRIREVFGWASIEDNGTNYVTSLEAANIRKGGQFRLCGPRPSYDNTTNEYPSKFVLEVQKP